ncbi:hypothetical protein HDE_07146 [Halotydeus destructor]|nr:hypothetical protein HDE_07146 [Halotydeus destructor]
MPKKYAGRSVSLDAAKLHSVVPSMATVLENPSALIDDTPISRQISEPVNNQHRINYDRTNTMASQTPSTKELLKTKAGQFFRCQSGN